MKALSIRSVAPVPIRFDEIRSCAKGYYDNANKEIVIQNGMSGMQTMKTAVHETAHAILHDKDIMQEQGIQKDQMTREVEAESVAFVSLALSLIPWATIPYTSPGGAVAGIPKN